MKLSPFRIERYYAQFEFTTRYMLSSSDCESRTIAEVLELEPDAHERLLEQWCGYTESAGSAELRAAIAALYTETQGDDVLVCSCAEEGIFLLYHALLGPGDHAIVETPCYESALQLARSTGAEVSEWRRSYDEGWAHDLDALERLLRPQTRLLYINQPHNPTGTLMSSDTLRSGSRARKRSRARPVQRRGIPRARAHPADRLPAACDVWERAVSLGSISKTYGLPGLRIGWLAIRDERLRARASELKDYTTICSSAPSELLTAVALRNRRVLIERNLGIVRDNLPLLDQFLDRHRDTIDWVRPTASAIGFPRLRGITDTDDFCAQLASAGVLLLPGSVYDQPGHVRVGFGRKNMPEALEVLDEQLDAVAAALRTR